MSHVRLCLARVPGPGSRVQTAKSPYMTRQGANCGSLQPFGRHLGRDGVPQRNAGAAGRPAYRADVSPWSNRGANSPSAELVLGARRGDGTRGSGLGRSWQMADGRWQMADGRWQMAANHPNRRTLNPNAEP